MPLHFGVFELIELSQTWAAAAASAPASTCHATYGRVPGLLAALFQPADIVFEWLGSSFKDSTGEVSDLGVKSSRARCTECKEPASERRLAGKNPRTGSYCRVHLESARRI